MGWLMDRQERLKNLVGIVWLYVLITGVFSFLNRMVSYIVQGISGKSISSFLLMNGLWIVAVLLILFFSGRLYRKLGGRLSAGMAEGHLQLIGVGLLVLINGIISLSNILPTYVISGIQLFQTLPQMDGNGEAIYTRSILAHAVSILLMLCQIFTGVYLLYRGKKSGSKE
jgi:hypothetical protein